MANSTGSVALRFERQDGAHVFEDPAVPVELTVEEVTLRAAPRLRYPTTDVSSGKPLKYTMLHEGSEVARDATVGRAFPGRRARVHIVCDYENGRKRDRHAG
jgi:hypothetical protein